MDNEALLATTTGDLEKLKDLLDQGININAQDDNGRTLLHHAASNGKHEVVKCLLENNADILIITEKNNTALHIAVLKRDDTMANTILENVKRGKLRKLLDTKTKASGTAALHVAAKNDCYENASVLLEYGANFEITNDAGEKPIDIAQCDHLRGLFKMIDKNFSKAKSGDEQLADDIFPCNNQNFKSAMNCRNNEGHTIIQVLVLNEHYRLANNLLWARVSKKPNRENELLHDPDRKNEVEKLSKVAKEFQDLWPTQQEGMQKFMRILGNIFATRNACKLGCKALEKAHEVLLAYREFEGKDKSLTADPPMKTLEEIIEVLGFDPEELFVVADEEACYYEKLPDKLQEDVKSFMTLIDGLVDATIDFFSGYIYAIQSFAAVKDNDVDKVEELINMAVFNNGVDSNHMTPLCYAARNGNEKIVKMLLKSTGRTVRETALSPVYLAASKGYTKIVKILMKNVELYELTEFIDYRMDSLEWTALHVAAKEGHLDIVKKLLKYGATYCILDKENHTPLDLSTKQEVIDYLKFVDDCFHAAKKANDELVPKLEAMQKKDFKAVTKARNDKGKTLPEVAANFKAKNIVEVISKRMEKILGEDQLKVYSKIF